MRLFSILLLLVSFQATAQITIPNTTFPESGDILVTAIDTAAGEEITFPLAAGSQNWNCFAVTPDFTDSTSFLAASEAPDFGTFPNTELVTIDAIGNQTFYNVETTKMDVVGYAGADPTGFGLNVIVPFVPATRYRTAPLSFGDLGTYETDIQFPFNTSFLPDSIGGFIPFDSLRIRINIKSIEFADAFGDISLPGGTFEVLRLRKLQYTETRFDAFQGFLGWLDVTDLLQLDFLGIDTTLSYTFFGNSFKEPMAVVTLAKDSSIANIQYKLMPLSPVDDAGLEHINYTVFPNPATTASAVQVKSSISTQDRKIVLLDNLGRSVWTGQLDKGAPIARLPLDQLPGGIYTLQILDKEGFTLHTEQISLN